jgi:hypothetical protein
LLPYNAGMPVDEIRYPLEKRKKGFPTPSRLADLSEIHIVVQEGTTYRRPDLTDDDEARIARGISKRILYYVERLEGLRLRPDQHDPEIATEQDAIVEQLCHYHRVVAIDVDGLLPRGVRILGPSGVYRNPNGRRPYVRRARPDRPMAFTDLGEGELLRMVAMACRRQDRMPMYGPAALRKSVVFAVGQDPELQKLARPLIKVIINRLKDAEAREACGYDGE